MGHARARSAALEDYRERLRQVDERLLALYGRRRRLVRELWELKEREGLPRKDPAQEERVIRRAKEGAGDAGLTAEEAERWIRWVLEEGHRTVPRAVLHPAR